jgi:hypothetical protein
MSGVAKQVLLRGLLHAPALCRVGVRLYAKIQLDYALYVQEELKPLC